MVLYFSGSGHQCIRSRETNHDRNYHRLCHLGSACVRAGGDHCHQNDRQPSAQSVGMVALGCHRARCSMWRSGGVLRSRKPDGGVCRTDARGSSSPAPIIATSRSRGNTLAQVGVVFFYKIFFNTKPPIRADSKPFWR